MPLVASDFVAWLKSPALYATTNGANGAAWDDRAKDSTAISALAYRADAQAECDAQAQFLAGPIARDTHVVKGSRSDLIGKCVRLCGDRMGYEDAGAVVFVIGATEADTGATTTLTVLKRLAA